MMETTRKYTIGDAELVAEILEGEVLQLDEVGTTHVHGQGGGGSVSNGSGHMSDVRISSHTSWETKVWVNHNGKEVQWVFPGSLAFRPGHKIAVCELSNGKKSLTCLVKNVTTDTEWTMTDIKQFNRFDVNKGLRGCGTLILSVLALPAIIILFMTDRPVILTPICIGLILGAVFSNLDLRKREKTIVGTIQDMYNDIKKNISAT